MDYYGTNISWYIFNIFLWFINCSYSYFYLNTNILMGIKCIIVITCIFMVLSLLSCTLLETEIANIKFNIINVITLNKNKNFKNQLKYMYCRLIHDNITMSCGFFDFNLKLISTLINLTTTFVFAIIQK